MSTMPTAASASPMPEGITDPNYQPPPGHLGNLTVVQLHTLEKLKKELKEGGHFVEERMDDAMLLRFLRARKFDLIKTKEMLLNAEKWRKDFGVDDIAKNFALSVDEQNVLNEHYPQYYHKTDKDGRPVYIQRLPGSKGLGALNAAMQPERQLKRLVFEYEKFLSQRLPACAAACGHPVETSCTILDVGSVTFGNFLSVKSYIQEASIIGQQMYPETMGKFYVINAPTAFTWIWSGITSFGWLDEVTVQKIKIFSKSSSNNPQDAYLAELLKQVPAGDLPSGLGGTCKCAVGCSSSDAGPWNPE